MHLVNNSFSRFVFSFTKFLGSLLVDVILDLLHINFYDLLLLQLHEQK